MMLYFANGKEINNIDDMLGAIIDIYLCIRE